MKRTKKLDRVFSVKFLNKIHYTFHADKERINTNFGVCNDTLVGCKNQLADHMLPLVQPCFKQFWIRNLPSKWRVLSCEIKRHIEHWKSTDVSKEHITSIFRAFHLLSSTLKMESICSSETLVDFQRTTRRYIPQDSTLHNHRCENLKLYI
jgi:hypothetical protein